METKGLEKSIHAKETFTSYGLWYLPNEVLFGKR